jgi:hypothetical protein
MRKHKNRRSKARRRLLTTIVGLLLPHQLPQCIPLCAPIDMAAQANMAQYELGRGNLFPICRISRNGPGEIA